ncbi:uncharacterized protein LOC119191141 [Manduca sexta]|uniref:uncharacterized protein LOC119191141 n=1 Tax=Manduca sexta TaxID=7130 RepID=UPI00188E6E11|nr:uncharacterized protein LOC119191141 [Manduca sexta]
MRVSAGRWRLHALHSNGDNSRAGTCRSEVPGRSVDTARHREGPWGGRLSAAVPDVAMAPNANTHLLSSLSSAHYVAHPLTNDYGGVVLQLDLGDGATHTPRPGSRAQRAGAAASGRQHRDHAQAMSCVRARPDDDELRAAIELSVIRAYSSLEGGRGRGARLDLRHNGPSARSCGSPGPPGPPARDLHTPPRLTGIYFARVFCL